MEWTDEIIARLRALWDDGHSTAEIGRRLAVSKNSVIGKAHRMELPARPSPIRREPGGPRPPRAPRRLSGPTLPPLPVPRPRPAMAALPRPIVAAPALAPLPRPAPPRPVVMQPARPYSGRVTACCWPIGEPGTPSFRFCDGDAIPGKPYCGTHAQIAYVKVRDRREDAA